MTPEEVLKLIHHLIALPHETEWVEWKQNNSNPDTIGEYLSALSNSATLHSQPKGYLLWGIDDKTHQIVGTTFEPHSRKVGNEELENWLLRSLTPHPNLRIHEIPTEHGKVVLFEVTAATHTPVRFEEIEYIRIGSYKKKLKEYPEKERALWQQFRTFHFEEEIALSNASVNDVLGLLDYPSYFALTTQPLPTSPEAIMNRLKEERLITPARTSDWSITNLGALLFAKDLTRFERLSRKTLRIIVYKDNRRVYTQREQEIKAGYAIGFAQAIDFIHAQLPVSERIGQAYREEKHIYPSLAIRELVANALIHQDFLMTGTGPKVEIFSDRVEITNPGTPLIEPARFIDQPPLSRNEQLARFMRRINICEERGSGIDKVISEIELGQLPPPDFKSSGEHTIVTLYAPKASNEMHAEERVRACYQHACLQYVSNDRLTNASLRGRFGIEEHNYSTASRIIADTVKAGFVKPFDPTSSSKKQSSYVPFWA